MNILFLSTRSPYPLISGHSLRTYHILKGAAQKHDVTLITTIQVPEHELKKENLDHLKSFCKAVHTFEIPTDLSKTKLATSLLFNLFSPLPFVAQKYDFSAMRQKIREILVTEKIDLVHVDMLPLSTYLDEFTHLPKILVNHNVESVRLQRWYQTETNPLKKAYLGLQWPKLKAFERRMLDNFDACVVVSETDKELLTSMGVRTSLNVVQNGTNTEFFKPLGRRKIENLVLWIGHMDVHTNKDAVVYFWREIYPLLRQKQPDVLVSFVGTSPPEEITRVALTDSRVRVTGFVDDVRPYIDEAAVIVIPIRIGSGTRLKILDCMAMGKAIVSTSVGCEGLNVTDGTDIVMADDPQSFAGRISELLKDESKRESIQRNARRLAETYDWKCIIDQQEIAYHYAIEGRKL